MYDELQRLVRKVVLAFGVSAFVLVAVLVH
jgi:hypothetical protein